MTEPRFLFDRCLTGARLFWPSFEKDIEIHSVAKSALLDGHLAEPNASKNARAKIWPELRNEVAA